MSVHHLFLKKINHISDKYTEKNTPFTNCVSSHLRRILREMRYLANGPAQPSQNTRERRKSQSSRFRPSTPWWSRPPRAACRRRVVATKGFPESSAPSASTTVGAATGNGAPPLEKQPIPAAMFRRVVGQHCCRNGR